MAQMVPQKQSPVGAVLFVGNTGVGKSSLINLITTSKVQSSASSESCTDEVSVYRMVGTNCILIDTPGMQDSKDRTDDTSFAEILQQMAHNSISNLKIIWCVKSGTGRKDANIQKQARFISLLHRKNSANIWRSVAIVERQPQIGAKLDVGVYDAAKKYGCQIESKDMRYIGATCLTWLTDATQREQMSALKNIAGFGDSIFDENELRRAISTVITDLPFTAVLYFNTRCGKCNVRYDRRYPPNQCHAAAEQYHNEQSFDTYRTHASNELGTYQMSAAGIGTAVGVAAGALTGVGVSILSEGLAAPLVPEIVAGGTAFGTYCGTAVGAAIGSNSQYHKCCELKKGSQGCVVKYRCCRQTVGRNVALRNSCPRLCRQCHQRFPAQPCLTCGDNVCHEPL